MKMDMHVHTSETSPCGKVPARDMVRMYADAGYGAIVCTDHIWDNWKPDVPPADRANVWLRGYRAAREEGEKRGVRVLLGAEVRLEKSGKEDFLTYGLSESDIPWLMRFLNEASDIAEVSRELRGRDYFFAQAHPFRKGLRPVDPSLLDGMEIYNGNPRHDSHNAVARGCALRGRLTLLSGSDAHQPQDVARGGMHMPDDIYDSAGLVAFLRASDLRYESAYAKIAIETFH